MKTRTVYKHFRVDKQTGYMESWFKPFKVDGKMMRPRFEPTATGGLTFCFIQKLSSQDVWLTEAWGASECSKKDHFCYAVGRKISYDRAVAMMEGKKIPCHIGKKNPARRIFRAMEKTYLTLVTPMQM